MKSSQKKNVEIDIKRILENGTLYDKKVRVDFATDVPMIQKSLLKYVQVTQQYNLKTLFQGFFEFYTNEKINFKGVLSIKDGTIKPRVDPADSILDLDNTTDKTSLFSIEDPFDDAHDPGYRILDNKDSTNKEAKDFRDEMSKARNVLANCATESDLEDFFFK